MALPSIQCKPRWSELISPKWRPPPRRPSAQDRWDREDRDRIPCLRRTRAGGKISTHVWGIFSPGCRCVSESSQRHELLGRESNRKLGGCGRNQWRCRISRAGKSFPDLPWSLWMRKSRRKIPRCQVARQDDGATRPRPLDCDKCFPCKRRAHVLGWRTSRASWRSQVATSNPQSPGKGVLAGNER